MQSERTSLEARLQAVGRILDRRPTMLSDVCLLQSGDGFIVHALEAGTGTDVHFRTPTTIAIDAAAIAAELAPRQPPPRVEPEAKSGGGWWRLR